MQPSSPTESSPIISDDQMEKTCLTPPILDLPSVKLEVEGDEEVQSPGSFWETFFSDHLVDGDFMISSPVRNLPSPETSSLYNNNTKAKGQSPLHKVFNSPNYNHFMQVECGLSLPAIEELLGENYYQPDNGYGDLTETDKVYEEMSLPQDGHVNGNDSNNDIMVGPYSYNSSTFDGLRSIGSSTSLTLSQHLQSSEQNHLLHHHVNTGLAPRIPITSEQEEDSGLQLVHLLLACAEAVAKEDYMLARRYLHHLNRVVTPLGDSMQRVASCFTEALSARLAATITTTLSSSSSCSSSSSSILTTTPKIPFSTYPPNPFEILKIYQILYQACPYVKFAHFTANQAIFEAFESEERVHVIDLDILQGYQWPAFMQALAARSGRPPFLRITGVGSSIDSVRETGRCLTELAHSLNIPFEFHPVGEQLEDVKPHMLNRRVGEALAVNTVNRLHRVVPNQLGNLLAMIRDQAPNIVTIVEQEASHNGPYFLGRFLEALHYYSAIFDSLDATFPSDSAQRAKVEQYIFGHEIRNIVACEGSERIERHERLEKWRKTMEGKGFTGIPLSENAVTQSKILLGLYSCDGYRLNEDRGCLLLGWQDRPILAASAWRC